VSRFEMLAIFLVSSAKRRDFRASIMPTTSSFAKEGSLHTFLVLADDRACSLRGWQLRLAKTKGKVWSRNGYVTREGDEAGFEACVVFYWVFVVWGAGMLIAIIISATK
jgi:hypothetical protein